jgi:hypothetical protein
MTRPPASASAMSHLAARAAIGAAALTLIALAALHVLRSDLDPSRHMLSEYAVGGHAWVMTACFVAFAAGSASLFVALMPQVRTVLGRIGLAFLLITAVGLTMAARFPMDPLSTPPEAASSSGHMHAVSAMIGMPGEIVAVLLLSLALRKQAPWAALPLLALTLVIWLGLGAMIASQVVAMQQPSMDGPGVVGVANRLLMTAYAVWLMLAAWPMARAAPR